ncbi:MAG TPA: CpsD/CapB family tyrosine-protein kinase [Terriglobales bacterium]|nr:CpsD/CapB family tyrosine-protein kinase [Terriglobales bacterium]
MSRIHDALKRAEQERASSLGGHVEPTMQPTDLQPVPQPEPIHSATAVMPAPNSAFSYETLLARCPQARWNPDSRTMLFFQEDQNRKGAEEFRTLRSRLYQIREKLPLKRLMVTSALPKEGKSFVAANLAQVIVRQQGRRALVIDADLRSPGMHRHLGASQTPGLSDYLMGECDEFAIMQRGPMENMFFVPAGRVVSGAPELLANGRLKLFLQRVEPLFDWIILDTPPVVPVADSTLLANFCDGVLMVVRSNATPSDLARRAREEFQEKLLLGVVLNGIPADQLPQSKYYYGEAVSSPA